MGAPTESRTLVFATLDYSEIPLHSHRPVRHQYETWDEHLPTVIARSPCDEANPAFSFRGGDGLLRSIERVFARPIGSQ
jgi:hypothetical protein